MTVGLAAPFSRPARSAVTLAALLFGITGVVLGTSLNASIHKINHSAIHGQGQLQTAFPGNSSAFTARQAAAARAAIRAQPGTSHYVAETDLQYIPVPGPGSPNSRPKVTVAGRPDVPLMTYAYDGDSSWLGWSLVSGRWYNGPGEVVVSTAFASDTHRGTGDSVTLTVNGKPVSVRIAGEVFIPNPVAAMWVSSQTLGGPAAGLAIHQYDMGLTPGTSPPAYTGALQRALRRALGPDILVGTEGATSLGGFLDTSLFAWLTLLVGVLAGLGVLNAALMATRERVHDLGVFKAVGMTPRQTITMVVCWVIAPAVIAAAIALPAGLIIQDLLVRQLTSGTALHGSRTARQLRARPGRHRPAAARPGRAGHRYSRRARPGQLGRQDQDLRGTAHRIAVRPRDRGQGGARHGDHLAGQAPGQPSRQLLTRARPRRP